MPGIIDLLTQQMGSGQLQQISNQLGTDQETTQKALATALPALLGGLTRNATSSPEGAASLARAIDQDHDGSVLDNVGGLLEMFGGGRSGGSGGPDLGSLMNMAGSMLGGGSAAPAPNRALNGDGILGHIFGDRKPNVERRVSQASGMDQSLVSKLLPMLAPIVMGALGKAKRQQNLDAGGLADMLNREQTQMQQQQPQLSGFMAMLDTDGDGDVTDDITKIGGSLLSSFLSGKR